MALLTSLAVILISVLILFYVGVDWNNFNWDNLNIGDVISSYGFLPEYVLLSHYWAYWPKWLSVFNSKSAPLGTGVEKLFTKEELAKFEFKYLCIVGEVYDVTKGERHYGKGKHYSFFTGKDGTRAFASGDFTEKGLIEDVSGLSFSDIEAIEGYRAMYAKDYVYVGKLIGHYYTAEGKETDNKFHYNDLLKEAEKHNAKEQKLLEMYPACNSEFNGQTSRVWCSYKSGGISRAWIGVPRRLYKPGMGQFRCACIKTTGPPSTDPYSKSHSNRGDLDNPHVREYEGCEPLSPSCYIRKNK